MSQQTPVSLLTPAGRMKLIEDGLYQNYLAYFRKAEDTRRWKLHRDIPWHLTNPDIDDDIAIIVEGFFAVESYLPDYVIEAMQMVRRSRGRAWFQANWGYEESKHAMAWETWLTTSGKRTPAQMEEYAEYLAQKQWSLPYDTPRRMIIYQMIQERATYLNYHNLAARARRDGDEALATALRIVAVDEIAHHGFFYKGVQLFLKYDPADTIDDLLHVLRTFGMPAKDFLFNLPEFEEAVYRAGIYGPREYIRDVQNPILNTLGYDNRRELERAALRLRIAPDSIGPQDIPDWVKEPGDRPADALVISTGE
jgi:acyl-[acyl-carrier-protein] desaturase